MSMSAISAVSQKPYLIEGTRYDEDVGVYAIIGKDMFQQIKPDVSILFVLKDHHPFTLFCPPPSYKKIGGIQKVIEFPRDKFDYAVSLVFKANKIYLALQEGLAKSQSNKLLLEEFAKASALNEQIIAQHEKNILHYTAKIAQHDQNIAQHDQNIAQHDQNISAAQSKIELGRKMQADASMKTLALNEKKASLLDRKAQNAAKREILLKQLADLEKSNGQNKTAPAPSQAIVAASLAASKSAAK